MCLDTYYSTDNIRYIGRGELIINQTICADISEMAITLIEEQGKRKYIVEAQIDALKNKKYLQRIKTYKDIIFLQQKRTKSLKKQIAFLFVDSRLKQNNNELTIYTNKFYEVVL